MYKLQSYALISALYAVNSASYAWISSSYALISALHAEISALYAEISASYARISALQTKFFCLILRNLFIFNTYFSSFWLKLILPLKYCIFFISECIFKFNSFQVSSIILKIENNWIDSNLPKRVIRNIQKLDAKSSEICNTKIYGGNQVHFIYFLPWGPLSYYSHSKFNDL